MRRWLAHLRLARRRQRAADHDPPPRVAVFAPSPLLTVTIERGSDRPEVHLHAGGQGVWVARLAATLGADVVLCCALGGEPGSVLRGLIKTERVTLRAADARTSNGVYVHDRRHGERVEIVQVNSRALTRHASDELYGIALGAGLDANVTLVTGCQPRTVVDAELYRRLIGDLRTNGKLVIADLTGPPLRAALRAGVDLLRLSDEELLEERYVNATTVSDLLNAARFIHAAGARNVFVSRAAEPALLIGERRHPDGCELAGPRFEACDSRGAGDSMFAAIGVGLARGKDMLDALKLGMAAGALNVTRHGLGTGTRREIERLAAHVTVRPLDGAGADPPQAAVSSSNRS